MESSVRRMRSFSPHELLEAIPERRGLGLLAQELERVHESAQGLHVVRVAGERLRERAGRLLQPAGRQLAPTEQAPGVRLSRAELEGALQGRDRVRAPV